MKKENKSSGKSKSESNPLGIRRKVCGHELAPRSIRKNGKRLLSECTEQELKKAGVWHNG